MTDIDVLLEEHRRFPPPAAFSKSATVADPAIYEKANADPVAFWSQEAKRLEWFTPWRTALEWRPPHVRWFVGGTLNVTVNCLDRHIRAGIGNRAAFIWEGEPGDRRTLTYWELSVEVN
jgi:acetyl-CoA synthetase